MRIELHVDRLVLDDVGVAPRSAESVREAVETELRRLLLASPARSWQASRRSRRVSGPQVRQGGQLGAAVARSVYGAVHRAD